MIRFKSKNRQNLLNEKEKLRPPAFSSNRTLLGKCSNWVRRLIDLQASSIHSDLRSVLPSCQGSFLDVGCGAQPYRCLLSDETRYLGIDTVDSVLRFGYQNHDTIYFNAGTWPVGSESQDTVMATETLEHVTRPAEFVAEALRVLKSGGNLVLTVPFSARWHYVPHDYWRFTPSGLGLLLSEAGFTSIEVYARGNSVTVACYKGLSLILGLLFSEYQDWITFSGASLLGILFLPAALLLAGIGHLSLRFRGGCDTLGYTVFAVRGK